MHENRVVIANLKNRRAVHDDQLIMLSVRSSDTSNHSLVNAKAEALILPHKAQVAALTHSESFWVHFGRHLYF